MAIAGHESIPALFAQHDLRCTRQRMSVYKALANCHHHPSADELHKMLADTDGELSLATVYNTLDILCGAGLAVRIPGTGRNDPARYDAAIDDHIHVRCRQTNSVRDVPHHLSKQLLEQLPGDLIRKIEDALNVQIDQVQIELVARPNE